MAQKERGHKLFFFVKSKDLSDFLLSLRDVYLLDFTMVTFCALYNYQNTPQAIPQQAALIRNIGAASVRLKVFDKLVSHINFHSDRVASDVLLVAF